MGFKNNYTENDMNSKIKPSSNLFEFCMYICSQVLTDVNNKFIESIPNEIECPAEMLSIDYFKKTLESESYRKDLLELGINTAIKYLETKQKPDKL
jgi:hypothetical protein